MSILIQINQGLYNGEVRESRKANHFQREVRFMGSITKGRISEVAICNKKKRKKWVTRERSKSVLKSSNLHLLSEHIFKTTVKRILFEVFQYIGI